MAELADYLPSFYMTSDFLNALYAAYLDACRHKHWKANTMQFSLRLEESLFALAADIRQRRYRIKPSLCFIAFRPVKREIFAGDFRDRVIHHLVFNELNPYYDRLFINDCYSCRKGRGTDYGINRLARFARVASRNYRQPAYVLKLDISGYFMNIDRRRLYGKNQLLLRRFFGREPKKFHLLAYLLRRIIFNDPTKNCRRRGSVRDWNGLPQNKSLFCARPDKGLPIGNLTSQLFGNVYLNDFDHFVKEKLKCRYYGRYVDDLIFVSADKSFLKGLIPKIDAYLKKELDLKLHPKKIYLQPISHGCKFLGTIVKPRRIYVGARIKANFYQAIKKAAAGGETTTNLPLGSETAAFNSYLGLMKKYQSYRLRRKMLTAPETDIALERLNLRPSDDYDRILYRPFTRRWRPNSKIKPGRGSISGHK